MSDFYKARLAATFTPASTTGAAPNPNPPQAELPLIRHNHLLAEPPTLEWSLQTASYEYIAHTWAGDLPTGNARLTLAAQPLLRANTRAALERKLRRLELALNLNREGSLLLEEAFSQGVPTLHTYWHAVIETANASPLPLDQAPPIPGAWGKLELSIILTHPSEEPPQDAAQEETTTQEEDESSSQDLPEPNPQDYAPAEGTPWGTDFAEDALPELAPYPSATPYYTGSLSPLGRYPLRMKIFGLPEEDGSLIRAIRVKAVFADATPGRLFLTTGDIGTPYTRGTVDISALPFFASRLISGSGEGPVDVDLFPCVGYEPTLGELAAARLWLGRGATADAVAFNCVDPPAGPCFAIQIIGNTAAVNMLDDTSGPYLGFAMYPNNSYSPVMLLSDPS